MAEASLTGAIGPQTSGSRSRDLGKPKWYQSKSRLELLGKLLVVLVLALGVVIIMIPALWMLSVSIMTEQDLYAVPPVWIPHTIRWQNYLDVLTRIPFFTLLRNTLFIAGGRLIGSVLTSSMAAFAFARLRARQRDWLFLLVLATMMLPGQVTLIPQFIIFTKLEWVNTFKPLIVPSFLGGGAYNIFLLRQFMMTLPLEYDDAALIDGASYFQLYYRIILPLSAPALATISIFTLMGAWNDFMGPLIYLKSMVNSTISLGLYFFRGVYNPQWSQLMAMSLMVMTPIVIIFFFAQRMFIQGVVISGVKG